MNNPTQGLSDEELEQLDNALMGLEDAMAVDEAHGFLCSLIVANCLPDDAEWLAQVANSTGQLDETSRNALLKMKAEIAATLQAGQHLEPLYIEVEDEDITYLDYSGWCQGFMFGLSTLDMDWQQQADQCKELIAPISRLALADEDDEDDLDEEEYAEMIEMIPGALTGLYRYWH